jgi:hypothetical protein
MEREVEMRELVKSAVAATLCAATTIASLPAESLAGPMSAAGSPSIRPTAPLENVHYRRYYRRHYYPRYGYDPGAAIFAGAALGLMGAGIAAASRPYYYPPYPYAYPYGYPYYPGYYSGWGW